MFSFLYPFLTKTRLYQSSLRFQYQTEYGPYLRHFPIKTSEPFYLSMKKLMRPYLNKKTIALDLGCGLGRVTIDIANAGVKKVIGLDMSESFVFEAKAIAKQKRNDILSYPCHGNCDFLHADAQKLPFPNNHVSFISAINILDRIPYPYKMIQECYRVLQPGGILFHCNPYHWFDTITAKKYQVRDIKDLISEKDWTIRKENDGIPYHVQFNPRGMYSYMNHLVVLQKIGS